MISVMVYYMIKENINQSILTALIINPYPYTETFRTNLQQKTFENIVSGDIAHNEQFHLLPQCLQYLYFHL